MRGPDLAAWVALLVALPLALVLCTSFVKFAVVLAVLRRALGGSAIPPASVVTAVALLCAGFVAAPIAERVWTTTAPLLHRGDAAALGEASDLAAAPVREFLQRHAPERERRSFTELQRRLRPRAERDRVSEGDLIVLAPAFVVAELRAAFQVGFLLFLPFLVIELVVATVLLGLGMPALPPAAVSLPFKLLLFVVVDGWHLLVRGLLLGYT